MRRIKSTKEGWTKIGRKAYLHVSGVKVVYDSNRWLWEVFGGRDDGHAYSTMWAAMHAATRTPTQWANPRRRRRNPAIPIKYKYGEMGWSGQLWSASAVQQVLQHMQPILRNKFGEYTWSIDGHAFFKGKGGYQIIAKAGKDTWTEGRGRTPQEALKDWRSGWMAIQEYIASPGSANPRRRRRNRRGKFWIQGAIRRPGALRRKLTRGYVPGYRLGAGRIPETVLAKAYRIAQRKGDTQTMRQINLARTFGGMRRRAATKRRRRYGRKAAN